MAAVLPATPEQAEALDELVGAGLLIPSSVPGVYGRGEAFERVRVGFEVLVERISAGEGAEKVRFPPVVPREILERVGYLKSFPHLAGAIFSFEGGEREAAEQEARASRHEDWSEYQRMTDLVLVPAACYPVYPAVASRGRLAPGGLMVDAGGGYVFRHEPSGDPARMQIFHQREMVRLGEPETVEAWRDLWRDRGLTLLRSLGLDAEFDVASDPFFGRSGRMLAANQREQQLKFEIQVPINGPEPTAVASFNYHQEHFSSVFGIETSEGETAHTACLGFGEERITIALFRMHGLDTARWPATVRELLWPAAA